VNPVGPPEAVDPAGPPVGVPGAAEESEPLPPIPKISWWARVREYFLGEDPTLLTALVPTCFLSMLLYTRHPATNFIFDEQEALLANPYVRASVDKSADIPWLAAFRRDFWGLLPERTIGSYRPLPDIVWRALWKLGARDQGAFPHAYLNVMLHGVNGALLVLLVFRWTRDRLTAWLTGLLFVATAVVTEAVTGVVGLADVLGGMGALLALLALNLRAPLMPAALCLATLVGLYSKESALCIVPLVPLAALLTADLVHPGRPLRFWRAFLALVATAAAFVFYVEMRRRLFPVATPADLTAAANAGKPRLHRFFAAALRWYAQPMLPHDPLNNPFIDASPPYRVAGALRVYARGLGQVLFPRTLSGDYSAPQEPIPDRLVFPESVIGGLAVIVPILACTILVIVGRVRARRREADPSWDSLRALLSRVAGWDLVPIVAFATMWILVSYFPVSNIPVVLPTVRAERFWYFPAIGSAMLLGMGSAALLRRARARGTGAFAAAAGALVLLFGFQCFAARRHAFDYTNDLVFWNATRKAVPRSAKAHLNYSVMLGARGDLPGRLASNEVAFQLAPQWPMASVYMGDTLCRMHRAEDALPHYLRGFDLGPNEMSLIALGLQCLWDEHGLDDDAPARGELQEVADKYPGSWVKYLVDDTLANGGDYHGVNPKYRPRGYNEGPKKEE
jgi:hypothetical protein